MKAYLISRGVTTTTYNSVDTITNQFQSTGWIDRVDCPLSNRGDMTNPTPWNYLVLREFKHRGTKRTFTGNGTPLTKLVGVVNPNVENEVRRQQNTVYNMALNRLNDKVRGGLDLSIALAESGTTKRMIKNTLRVLSHARRLKPPGGYGSTRDVANGYLQYKYGWKPLLSDVFNVANESIRIVTNKLLRVNAAARIPEDRIYTKWYGSFGSNNNVPIERTVKRGSFSGCKIGVSLEIPTSSFQLDRWTSLNPLSITWELIPYSFVVDWFVDIGSYLRNLETGLLYGAQFRRGYVSEIWRVDLEDKLPNWMSPIVNDRKNLYTDVVGEFFYVEFRRTMLATYPFPRRPTFSVDLSSGQMFSAAALLRQLLPGSSRAVSPRRRPGPTLSR